MTFFSLEDATFRCDGREVLAGTNWRVGVGEHWAVVGANGSGKSLLLRGVSGRLVVTAGRLRHHFLESDPRCRDSTYGVLPHGSIELVSPGLPRHGTAGARPFHQTRWHATESHGPSVVEMLAYETVEGVSPFRVDADLRDRDGYEECRRAAIERLGLEPLMERRLWELSSGEQRRLALAHALCRAPRLLLVDDPLAGLDAAFRAQLRGVLAGLVADGVKVLLAVRSAEDLPDWVTHVLRLESQRVVEAGSRQEVFERVPCTLPPGPSRAPGPGTATSEAGEALVAMRQVRVQYGAHVILNEVDWSVRRGEHWAVIGRNGAGKSTLLSLVLGDNPMAYANDVRLFGRRRGSGESIWELRARIGWMGPELDGQFPASARCLDVVCSGFAGTLGLVATPRADERARAHAALQLLGIDAVADESLVAVSDAERRLVLIGRALVHDPCLLVLDEPCQGLDAAHVDVVRRAVDLAASQSAGSVVYVTHAPEELPDCISHALVLEAGRPVRCGAVSRQVSVSLLEGHGVS